MEFNNNKKQKTLTFDPSEMGGVGSLLNFSFNEKKAKELVVHMVLFHEYPFNMIEHELFNKFMRACMLHWKTIIHVTFKITTWLHTIMKRS